MVLEISQLRIPEDPEGSLQNEKAYFNVKELTTFSIPAEGKGAFYCIYSEIFILKQIFE